MNSDQKIVIVTRSMQSGGAERVIAQLSNYLVNKAVACTIVTLEDIEVFYDLDTRVKVTAIGSKDRNKIFNKTKQYIAVRNIVKKEKPDLVLSLPEDTGIYVLLALFGTGIPIYVSERNNPWVMPIKKAARILRKMMYPFAKGLIFQTETAKSFFSENIQKKGIVLKNPVEAERIPQPYNGTRKKVIASAGRLDTQKNFEMLINAFSEFVKEYEDYKLIIYGEGRLREKLELQIETLKLNGKVELPGRKSNLLELMNDAAMFVLPSDYEGMPNVLLEAMCMGMPVISTDCPSGGPRELIDDGINGILVPVGDREALKNAMCRMTDVKAADKMAANAYKIKDEYSGNKIFEAWEEYLTNKTGGEIS